jgi:hypothetical protein
MKAKAVVEQSPPPNEARRSNDRNPAKPFLKVFLIDKTMRGSI